MNVYSLVDSGSNLSFITPLVDRMFDILHDVLIEPFLVCTQMGDFVYTKRFYMKYLSQYSYSS